MKKEWWVILSVFIIMVGYALLSHTSELNDLNDQTGQTTVPLGMLSFSSPDATAGPAFYVSDNYPSIVLQLDGDSSYIQGMTMTKTNQQTGQTESFAIPPNKIYRENNLLFPYAYSTNSQLFFDSTGTVTGISYSNIGITYSYRATVVTSLGTYAADSPPVTTRP